VIRNGLGQWELDQIPDLAARVDALVAAVRKKRAQEAP
jgi:hypothetical protein